MTLSTELSCTIPVSSLRASPYSLPWGSSVVAKIVAINYFGDSLSSLSGNGAVITTTPDPPTGLLEDYSKRTKSTLALTWTAPVFTGGALIEDYRVSVAEQGSAFTVLQSGVTSTTYTAISLTAGVTYEFKVEAKNSYGYSSYSDVLQMICAFKPDAPVEVTTENVNSQVKVTWGSSSTNGSPLLGYKIFIRSSDGVTYT